MSNKGAAVWAAEMSCGMAGHACRMLFGEDGQIMEATPLLLERLGYSQEELLAKKLWDLVPTENAFHLRGKLASLSTNGKFHLLRVRLLNKSGFPVFVQLSGEALEVGGRRCIRCSVSESGVR
ncbi:MAG: PAS domain-containing protein, partial [Kiritimatiellaeota bacterium]|nr:PAS domain-containing protein [Kiritimatiellota bacterium]